MRNSTVLSLPPQQGTFIDGGKLRTVDLLELTSLDQLLSIMKTLFTF
jgi:hypothetical protein